MKIRFCGDVHGKYELLLPLLKEEGVDYFIQVGDLGLDYSYLRRILTEEDLEKFKVIGGNHDCYQEDSEEYFKKQPFFLGDYGIKSIEDFSFFYVRGAWSIDHRRREHNLKKKDIIWWEAEELFQEELDNALELYKDTKPDFVVTHDAPFDLVPYITDPEFAKNFGYFERIKTRTTMALQAMFEFHRPKTWICGHYHTRCEINLEGTNFIVLDMLRTGKVVNSYIDFSM